MLIDWKYLNCCNLFARKYYTACRNWTKDDKYSSVISVEIISIK